MPSLKFKKPKFTKPNITIKPPKLSKLSWQNIFALIKKELSSYFNSPLAYIIILVALVLHFFFFFILGDFFNLRLSDLSLFFSSIPWVLIVLIPTLTMNTIAGEEKEGTLEYLLSKPISTLEFVLSKLLSVVFFTLIFFATELPLLITLFIFGRFDYGLIVGQYLAAISLVFALASFGVFTSSLTKSAIGGFLTSFVGNTIILLIGIEAFTIKLPLFFAPYIERMSLLPHFTSMSKGVLTLSDVLYFVGFTLFFTALTYFRLSSSKYPKESKKLHTIKFYTVISLCLIVLITAYGQRIPGRIDLTSNKLNSLTETSKKLVRNLPEKGTIEVYYSDNLPSRYQVIKRDLFNMLREYKNAAGEKLDILYKSTNNDQNRSEADTAGIQQLNFQEFGIESLQFSSGYLGLVIKYQDKSEAIPTVLNTNNLEYDISSILKSQSVPLDQKKKIGFLNTKTKYTSLSGLTVLNQVLSKEYVVEPITFDDKNRTIDQAFNAVIVGVPFEEMSDEMKGEIRRYFNDGGSLFLMVDPVEVQAELGLVAMKNANSLGNFFEDLGIKVEPSMIFDTESALSISYGNYPFPVVYPLFPVVYSSGGHKIVDKIENINLRWAGWISIDNDKAKSVEYSKLFETSPNASFQTEDNFNIDPSQDFAKGTSNNEALLTAIAFNEKDEKPGRAVVIADGDFISDETVVNRNANMISEPQNIAFAMSAVEWLAQDESLAEIRTKERVASPLVFPRISINGEDNYALVPFMIQYLETSTLLLLVIGYGALRLYKRKKLSQK